MTNSRRARAIAAAVALLACVRLWRDNLWFQQVAAHQATTGLGNADGIGICDPFPGDAFYHTPGIYCGRFWR